MGKVAKSFWLCVWMPCLQQTVPRARPAALPRARCIESKAVPRVHGIGQKLIVEELRPEFILDPSQCLGSQANTQYPDFKPKKTGKGLWLNNKLNLPWVEAKVAALPPGTVQLQIFSWNARLARQFKAGQCELTMDLFQQMQEEGMSPDKFTFVGV